MSSAPDLQPSFNFGHPLSLEDDVVDLLLVQHAEVRQALRASDEAQGPVRGLRVADLAVRLIAHLSAVDLLLLGVLEEAAGPDAAERGALERERLGNRVESLLEHWADHDAFDDRFAVLWAATADRLATEERDELPLVLGSESCDRRALAHLLLEVRDEVARILGDLPHDGRWAHDLADDVRRAVRDRVTAARAAAAAPAQPAGPR